MQTRNVLLLPFVVALAMACGEASPPPPDSGQQHPQGLRAEARAERQRAASRRLVTATAGATLATATELVAALDLPAGSVTSATLTAPAADVALVFPQFGDIKPRAGTTLAVLSTGLLDQAPNQNTVLTNAAEPGTDFAPSGTAGDVVTLRLTFNLRAGISRLSFHYRFLSAESPDFIGSEFNDVFQARVTDANGTRVVEEVTVNSAHFFDVSHTRAKDTGFDLFADDPADVDYFPVTYSGIPIFPDAGITNYKIVNVPVQGGGPLTLEFSIQDLGDGILDSAVLLDNVAFTSLQVVDPNEDLIHRGSRSVEQDPVLLTDETKGANIRAVVADGATQLVVRSKVSGPGNMVFSLPGGAGLPNGALSAIGSSTRGDSVSVPAVLVGTSYYALALYTSPEDFNDGASAALASRVTNLFAAFTPTGGTQATEFLPLTLVRPPLVVIHDIWSSCTAWKGNALIYDSTLFDITCADYSHSNAAGIDTPENKDVFARAVDEALTEHRHDNVAVTQVDVLAHGMGGLMARKFVDRGNYRDDSNFDKGSLNRLITMNTPHVGARIADKIVEMREYVKTLPIPANGTELPITTLNNTLFDVDILIDGTLGGAIDDLRTQSLTINSIQDTRVPSHALVGTQGNTIATNTAFPMLLHPINVLYRNLQGQYPSLTAASRQRFILAKKDAATNTRSGIFCDDPYDLFLAEADQQGGFPTTAITGIPVSDSPTAGDPKKYSDHFRSMKNTTYNNRVIELLNSPVSSNLFAASIISPRNVTRETSCPPSVAPFEAPLPPRQASPLLTPQSLQIVSPAPGTPVAPGSRVTVSVQGINGFSPQSVYVTGGGQAAFMDVAPFTTQFEVPPHAMGTVTLRALGFDAASNSAQSASISLPVVSSARLQSISVINRDTTLRGEGAIRRLVVLGHYDDGVTRDISSPALGTIYTTSNPAIATVTMGGTVTSQGEGLATIGIGNGAAHTSITVHVDDGSIGHCLDVHLADHNLYVLGDYRDGFDVGGQVAAGGNILLKNFQVGWRLPATEATNVLVAGGNLTLQNGTVWGNTRYGAQLFPSGSVVVNRGTAARGTPIDFNARFATLRDLSTRLNNLPRNGTTVRAPLGGILLSGADARLNVFNMDASIFTGATQLSLDAPAGSLAVINVRGPTANLANFGQTFAGGIDETGVLFNFPDATTLTASNYNLRGTVLAPNANINFQNGSWKGGIYARSLTGNAVGHISRLRDTTICH
ncbi:choice-of-anchor A family protein [Corallococcus terminator]